MKKLQILLLFSILHFTASLESLTKLLSVSKEFLSQGTKYKNNQVYDTTRFLQEYDFIIVGAGSAGSIVANRLSENPHHSVLLIEAGGDENYALTIPLVSPLTFPTKLNWGYHGEKENSCKAFTNDRCNFPRGKVLGGTSVINALFFTRGNKKDYDRWEEMGNYDWGYDKILQYFKKLEKLQIPEYINELRGTEGPIPINYTPYSSELGASFIKSVTNLGYEDIDYNGQFQTGVSKVQYNMQNASRYSTNRAYLMPIKYRRNLHVSKNSLVTKIIIDPDSKIAKGVELIKNGHKYNIYIKKEVILSAGAFGSAQLLMLSGIGPKEHLKQLNIPLMQNLKVGYNLQDHSSFLGLLFLIDQPLSINFKRIINNLSNDLDAYFNHQTGPLSTSVGSEAVAFINSKYNNDTSYPDVELIFGNTAITQDPLAYYLSGLKKSVYDNIFKPIENYNAFTILPIVLRPKSIGRLTLKSRNPNKLPKIITNYFKEDYDINIIVEAIKIAIKITESEQFKKYDTRLHKYEIPGCDFEFGTDEFWGCAVRYFTFVTHHFCGTAKMGPETDPDAVVDPELRVYGVKGLRVVDASIMPFVPTAHINAPVMMIAEKGADMIKNASK